VAHGVHPARRPSGVLLLTRVTGLAALDELRGFKVEPRLNGNSKGNGHGHGKNAARTRQGHDKDTTRTMAMAMAMAKQGKVRATAMMRT
jgi:hypothetical protein